MFVVGSELLGENVITDQAIFAQAKWLPENATFVLDRGYDRNSLLELFVSVGIRKRLVIRMKDNRLFLSREIWRTEPKIAQARKGKVRMEINRWNRDTNRLEHKRFISVLYR